MRIAHFSPGHVQTADMVRRWREEGQTAEQWLGAEQPDPQSPAEAMCRCAGALSEVHKAGGSHKDLCGTTKRGFCPHHEKGNGELCGFRRQQIKAADGTVLNWAFSHANLAHPMPAPLKAFGFNAVVIDESPWLTAMLGGFGGASYKLAADFLTTDFTSGVWALPAGHDEGDFPGQLVNHVAARINAALDPAGTGRLRKSALVDITPPLWSAFIGECNEAASLVYRAKIDPSALIIPGMSEAAAAKALKEAKERNSRIAKFSRLFTLVAQTLKCSGDPSPYIWVVEEDVDTPDGPAPVLFIHMKWRKEIHRDWLALSICHLDATMRPEIAQKWLLALDVKVPAETATVPAGVYIRQVVDRPVSYGMIRPDQKASTQNQTTQRNNCALIARHMEVSAQRYWGTGAAGTDTASIMPKLTEKEVIGHLTPTAAIGIGHFGNLRGFDGWKDVAYLCLYGRPQVKPAEVEEMAWVVFGEVGRSLNGDTYPTRPVGRLMADGTGRAAVQIYHPDPQAEAVRWLQTEGELMQDIARARHVWRDETRPLRIDIATNVPLPLPVNELITWETLMDEANPVALMAARGIVPADWKGRALVLADLFKTAKAVKMWFQRNPDAGTALEEVECVPNSNKKLFYWSSGHIRGSLFSYRREGDRKGSTLLARSDLSDPRSVAESYLGPLDRWEAIHATTTDKEVSMPHNAPAPAVVASASALTTDANGFRWFGTPGTPATPTHSTRAEFLPGPSAWFKTASPANVVAVPLGLVAGRNGRVGALDALPHPLWALGKGMPFAGVASLRGFAA
jgi:putative DNA primase/helicase